MGKKTELGLEWKFKAKFSLYYYGLVKLLHSKIYSNLQFTQFNFIAILFGCYWDNIAWCQMLA